MYQEFYGDLKELFLKLGRTKRFIIMLRRIAIQWGYFFVFNVICYFTSYFRLQISSRWIGTFMIKEIYSVGITIFFSSILVIFFMVLTKNQYYGMGISIVIWFFLVSPLGTKLGPYINPIWSSPKADSISDINWIKGKIICIIMSVILLFVIKYLCEKDREGVISKVGLK